MKQMKKKSAGTKIQSPSFSLDPRSSRAEKPYVESVEFAEVVKNNFSSLFSIVTSLKEQNHLCQSDSASKDLSGQIFDEFFAELKANHSEDINELGKQLSVQDHPIARKTFAAFLVQNFLVFIDERNGHKSARQDRASQNTCANAPSESSIDVLSSQVMNLCWESIDEQTSDHSNDSLSLLLYFEGLSVEQIARFLNQAPANIEKDIRDQKTQLKKSIREKDFRT